MTKAGGRSEDGGCGGVSRGINELSTNVSQLLSELVEREKSRGDCAEGDEDEEDSSEEDEEPEDPQNSQVQPPAKKSKT